MRPNKKEMIKSAKLAARRGGCTCDPDVSITSESGTGVYGVSVAHDDFCVHWRDEPELADAIDHYVRSLGHKQ